MDPITLIVTALALGAAAGLKATTEQVVKDAYAGLKELIRRKYSNVDLAPLEEDPGAEAQRAVVKDDLSKTDAGRDEELLHQAMELLDAIQNYVPEAADAVGVDLEDIKAASLHIEDIIASGTGVSVKKTDIEGDIEIKGVRAGKSGEKDPNP